MRPMKKNHFVWLFFTSIFWSVPGLGAVDKSDSSSGTNIFGIEYLFQVLGSLIVVLACLYGLLFLMRKLSGTTGENRKAISVLDSTKVGAREKILLLRAGGQHLLVGVAAGNVQLLYAFDGSIEGDTEESAKKSEFSSLIDSSLLPGFSK